MLSACSARVRCYEKIEGQLRCPFTLAILNRQSYKCNYTGHRQQKKQVTAHVNQPMENMGIDPITSRMLSEHSTIWANSPPVLLFHVLKQSRGLVLQLTTGIQDVREAAWKPTTPLCHLHRAYGLNERPSTSVTIDPPPRLKQLCIQES